MREFHINTLGKEESTIVCGAGALKTLSCKEGGTFVFTDENVFRIYRELIHDLSGEAPVFVMPAGENYKTPQTLFDLLAAMAKAELHRGDKLVCIGGGVAGDIGGLAAALYMRGIDCVQVPTTLLSQVDSSVGGKTAVDYCGVKNLVGVFRQPAQVIVDPLFLHTLPERELKCGLGEIVKHAALNGELFDTLIQHRDDLFDLQFLAEIVPQNIAIKADVVQKDAREGGLRKCLNLGHTTAHAFELYDGKLSHGEYVLVGILLEAELAKQYTECDGAYLDRLKELALAALGTMPSLPSGRRAAEFARLDKKNKTGDTVTVTAPAKRGEYALLEITFAEYADGIARILEESI